jgi:hypothetical protein
MELSRRLRDHSRTIAGKDQLIIGAFAKALEVRAAVAGWQWFWWHWNQRELAVILVLKLSDLVVYWQFKGPLEEGRFFLVFWFFVWVFFVKALEVRAAVAGWQWFWYH